MSDRTVRVQLSAATQQFESAMRQAQAAAAALEKGIEQVEKATGKADEKAKSFGQQLRDAHTAGDLSKLASQTGRVGAAWTAVNAIVAKTGIEYNTLQQTSRAALTSITGSAQAANAQMNKLDAFARTSPFAKDVFIRAQQQMMAFGIESEKVIPYLSAINDAVAAAGGNNETLAQISYVMSQISAQGKITAVDLMQFGNAGVNAAELIGSQMGKTGAEIKESITAGTLDADAALDALAAGMSERFAGAAANVKDTMAGALDRVKAAFRDLSAEMLSGAVDPNGGGWLVDLTNQLANMMRTVQQIPQPIRETFGALSGLGGASLLAVAGVTKLVDAGLSMKNTWASLHENNEKLATGLGKLGKAASLAAAGMALMSTVGRGLSELVGTSTVQDVDTFTRAVQRAVKAGGDLAELDILFKSGRQDFLGSDQLVYGINNVADAMARLKFAYESGGIHFDRLVGRTILGLVGMQTETEKLENVFARLDDQLAGMENADAAAEMFLRYRETAAETGLAIEDLLNLFPEYANRIQNLAAANELGELSGEGLADAMAGVYTPLNEAQAAAADAEEAIAGVGVTAEEAAEKVVTLAGTTIEATKEQQALYQALGQAGGQFVDVLGAYDQVIEKNKELSEAARFSAAEYIAALDEQIAAQENWQRNLVALAGKVSSETLAHLAEMGPKAAPLLEELANGPQEMLDKVEESIRRTNLGEAFGATLSTLPETLRAAAEHGGQEAVDALMAQFNTGEIDLGELEMRLRLLPDTEEAVVRTRQEMAALERMDINLAPPRTHLFEQGVQEAKAKAEAEPATVEVEADPTPAQQAIHDLIYTTNAAVGTTTVDADTDPAKSATSDVLELINSAHGHIQVDANTSPAEAAARAALDRISRMSATVQIRAHHAAGFHAPMADGGRTGDALGTVRGMTSGGRVSGPGTTTSDTAGIIAVSNDEYVLRAWAASRIGYQNLDYANRYGRFPEQRLRSPMVRTGTAAHTSDHSRTVHVTFGAGAFHISGLSGAAAAEDFMRQASAALEQLGG